VGKPNALLIEREEATTKELGFLMEDTEFERQKYEMH
jgi:hypothetical protein